MQADSISPATVDELLTAARRAHDDQLRAERDRTSSASLMRRQTAAADVVRILGDAWREIADPIAWRTDPAYVYGHVQLDVVGQLHGTLTIEHVAGHGSYGAHGELYAVRYDGVALVPRRIESAADVGRVLAELEPDPAGDPSLGAGASVEAFRG